MPLITLAAGYRSSLAAMASISERSAMSVDDPGAIQIVGGQLATYSIPGEDPNAEAAHLAGHVPQHDVIVVELYAEHRVRQGLDYLALEFNLVFLCHEYASDPVSPCSGDHRCRFSSTQTTSVSRWERSRLPV
jgi:hypothetical protein